MTSVREGLRAATADIHEALHGAAPFARIAGGRMDRAGYVALLQFLFSYHAGMESACSAGAARLGTPELAGAQHRRLSALRTDLAVFGTVPAVAAPAPQTGDFAVGCFYTVLGSTLGGKVIHRQLGALLPGEEGRSFFRGSLDDGALWRLFCERLEDAELNVVHVQAGAAHAFQTFAAMLDQSARLAMPA